MTACTRVMSARDFFQSAPGTRSILPDELDPAGCRAIRREGEDQRVDVLLVETKRALFEAGVLNLYPRPHTV